MLEKDIFNLFLSVLCNQVNHTLKDKVFQLVHSNLISHF